MKKLIALLPLVLLQFCSAPPTETVEEKIKQVENSLSKEVYFEGDSLYNIEARMKHYHVPGVSMAVIHNYEIVWVKSWGIMDEETGDPVTGETLFQAGSISKPVAAYGALKLVEEGKIDLNENVNTYLKSWQLPDNEFTQNKKVALKHLLSHTGGVTVHGFWGYSPDLPVPTLLQVLDGAAPANSPPIRVDKVPEESPRYSGGGYCIMQQMLIDIEGKPFPQILNEKVLAPLAMTHSTYNQPLDSVQIKMAATGYLPDGTQTKGKRHTYPEMAAAGLWTTAEDLAKFAVHIQKTLKTDNNTVLSQEMTEKMLTPFVADHVGLGIFLENRDGEKYFGHGGWDEGFSSELKAHRNKGYGVVVLTNSNHPPFINELIRAVATAYKWDNYNTTYKKMAMDTTKFSTIRGRYRNGNDGLMKIYTEGGRLYGKFIRGNAQELFQIDRDTYISSDQPRKIQFATNPADGVQHLIILEGGERKFERAKLREDEKIPYEYLLAGDYDNALKGYQALLKANPNDRAIAEDNMNDNGYNFLRKGDYAMAKSIFKINITLYPNSANTYDSYAEACMKNGEKALAIENYKKSLSLNPKNENAEKMLKELGAGK
jgi:CubicO group peptidase (beta-lactamase class C family)